MSHGSQILLVAVGSACGGLARWAVGLLAGRWYSGAFPLATWVINVLGSFVLGWLLTALAVRSSSAPSAWAAHEAWRLSVGVGFCGAFTTFSTLEFEADRLLRHELASLATLYVAASFACGLVALRAGVWLGERW